MVTKIVPAFQDFKKGDRRKDTESTRRYFFQIVIKYITPDPVA